MTKIRVPYNKTYQKQNTRLVPYSFKKAVISSVNTKNNSADISFIGNSQTVVKNIPFASYVNVMKVNPGDKCKVDVFDPSNPSDMVIAYTYGNNSSAPIFSQGTITIVQGVVNTIPHRLGVIPNFVNYIMLTYPAGGSVIESSPADVTNIYLQANGTGIGINFNITWQAGNF